MRSRAASAGSSRAGSAHCPVSCDDFSCISATRIARRERRRQHRRALLSVVRHVAALVHGADCYRVDRVSVAVKVAVVTLVAAVAAGDDVNGAETASTSGYSVDECSLCKRMRPVEGLGIVFRTPGARVDIVDIWKKMLTMVKNEQNIQY